LPLSYYLRHILAINRHPFVTKSWPFFIFGNRSQKVLFWHTFVAFWNCCNYFIFNQSTNFI